MTLPIDIINKILIYMSQINDDIMTIQYKYNLNEFYIFNKYSTKFIDIEALQMTKRTYPLYMANLTDEKYRQLYYFCKNHYKQILYTLNS